MFSSIKRIAKYFAIFLICFPCLSLADYPASNLPNASKSCNAQNSYIEIHMGKVALRTIRGGKVCIKDGACIELRKESGDYTCQTKVIDNVRSFEGIVPLGSVGAVKENSKVATEYKRNLEVIKKAKNGNLIKKYANGVLGVPFERGEILLLPQSGNPTQNDEQVAIVCDINTKMSFEVCRTRYIHPSGLVFTYEDIFNELDGKKIPIPDEYDWVSYDKKRRQSLEDKIIPATH